MEEYLYLLYRKAHQDLIIMLSAFTTVPMVFSLYANAAVAVKEYAVASPIAMSECYFILNSFP